MMTYRCVHNIHRPARALEHQRLWIIWRRHYQRTLRSVKHDLAKLSGMPVRSCESDNSGNMFAKPMPNKLSHSGQVEMVKWLHMVAIAGSRRRCYPVDALGRQRLEVNAAKRCRPRNDSCDIT